MTTRSKTPLFLATTVWNTHLAECNAETCSRAFGPEAASVETWRLAGEASERLTELCDELRQVGHIPSVFK